MRAEHAADFRPFKPSPCDEPPPEVPILLAPPQSSRRTQPQWKIKEQDGVRSRKTDFERIIGTEIPIHDPARLAGQLLLSLHPLVKGQRDQARLPKVLIQLDDRKAE